VSLVAVAGGGARRSTSPGESSRKGFTGIYCPSPATGFALCEALALATREIPFGTSIAHIYTRHVFEWAQTAAVITRIVGRTASASAVGVSHGPATLGSAFNPGKPLDDVRRFVTELKTYAPQVGALPPRSRWRTLRRKMVALAGEIAEAAVWANAARSHMAESLRHLSDARPNDPSFSWAHASHVHRPGSRRRRGRDAQGASRPTEAAELPETGSRRATSARRSRRCPTLLGDVTLFGNARGSATASRPGGRPA